MALLKYYIILILLALTLSACGGGGGDDSNHGGGDGDNTSDGQNVNGGLTGRLFVVENDQGWAIDLASGIPSQLPSKKLWDTGDYDGYSVYFHPLPNHDGSELLLFVNGCFREFDGRTYDFDCLSLIDDAGESLTKKIVFDDGIIYARLSRDGNYVAVVYADEYYVGPTAPCVRILVASFETQEAEGRREMAQCKSDIQKISKSQWSSG